MEGFKDPEDALFPIYHGETKTIQITSAYMLSVNIPKYNQSRKNTLLALQAVKLPKIQVHLGYRPDRTHLSTFSRYVVKGAPKANITVGFLEMCSRFIRTNPPHSWAWFFEDDVRACNVKRMEDLTVLYHVPIDAEMIIPIRTLGNDKVFYHPQQTVYRRAWGGGMNQAMLVSTSACQKIIRYAKKFGWKYVVDIDLYRLAKDCLCIPTGYDGHQENPWIHLSKKIPSEDKISMYSMNSYLFNQTSLPNECETDQCWLSPDKQGIIKKVSRDV